MGLGSSEHSAVLTNTPTPEICVLPPALAGAAPSTSANAAAAPILSVLRFQFLILSLLVRRAMSAASVSRAVVRGALQPAPCRVPPRWRPAESRAPDTLSLRSLVLIHCHLLRTFEAGRSFDPFIR